MLEPIESGKSGDRLKLSPAPLPTRPNHSRGALYSSGAKPAQKAEQNKLLAIFSIGAGILVLEKTPDGFLDKISALTENL